MFVENMKYCETNPEKCVLKTPARIIPVLVVSTPSLLLFLLSVLIFNAFSVMRIKLVLKREALNMSCPVS